MKQIKITLSDKFYTFLKYKANVLDVPLSQYVKFILMKEVQSLGISANTLKSTISEDIDGLIRKLEIQDKIS